MKVHLWGELGFYGPGRRGRFDVRIDGEMAVADAVRLVGVPIPDVAVTGLNGEVVRIDDPTATVTDRDRIDLFPPSSGG